MDGTIDSEKIQTVFDYAKAANINPHYLQQLRKTLEKNFTWLIKDITYKNLESFDIFPELNNNKDIENWLFPYRGNKRDPQLIKRYENLKQLPEESFGYHIWLQFKNNHYKFPGDKEGVNYRFVMPHDSLHILSDYDTSPYGELLVSIFTSTMLEKNPINGHVIPVMYSFYLGIKINDHAGSAQVKIDPTKMIHVKELKNIHMLATGKDHFLALDKDGKVLNREGVVTSKSVPISIEFKDTNNDCEENFDPGVPSVGFLVPDPTLGNAGYTFIGKNTAGDRMFLRHFIKQ
jgi:hypothetical protein